MFGQNYFIHPHLKQYHVDCSIQVFRNPFDTVAQTMSTKVHMPLNKSINTILKQFIFTKKYALISMNTLKLILEYFEL